LRRLAAKSPQAVAKLRACVTERATLIIKMAKHLCSESRWHRKSTLLQVATTLADEVCNVWKKKGTDRPMAPSTLDNYTSAISAACDLCGVRLGVDAKWRGITRSIQKRLATHRRRQAFPLSRTLWRKIVVATQVRRLHRRAIIMCWMLALRVGDLKHIKPSSVTIMHRKGIKVARVDMSGVKGHNLGTASHFKYIPIEGVTKSLLKLFNKTSPLPLDEQPPLIAVSTSAIRQTLKRFDGRLSSHSIRRGVATHLSNSGVAMRRIQRVLGHKEISTTRMYIETSLRQKAVQQAVQIARRMC
jgi:integrase